MTTLYRIYGRVDERDQNGLGPCGTKLIYVGITDNYDQRMAQHSEKAWFHDIVRITREEHSTREEAIEAERTAIKTEHPVRNRTHNKVVPELVIPPRASKHPERGQWLSQAQAADYLGVTDRTIRNYIARGLLPASRIGSRLVRVKASDLDALLCPIPTVATGA